MCVSFSRLKTPSIYQEHVSKALVDKYTNLTVDLDKVITDANTQITTLNNKVSSMYQISRLPFRDMALIRSQGMDLDQQALRRKNEELAVALKEKNKKLMQTQELYDKLKRRAMMGQMQHAAENAVDSNLPSLDVREGDGQGISPRNEAAVLGLHEAGMGPSFPEFHHVRISNENDGGVDHARSFNHRRTGLYPWDQVAGGSGGKYIMFHLSSSSFIAPPAHGESQKFLRPRQHTVNASGSLLVSD